MRRRSSNDACAWCCGPLDEVRSIARYCSKRCRQSAFRLRRRGVDLATGSEPLRFAYADPPYPGKAARYYQHEPDYAGEVDHAQLVAWLEDQGFDGWALSTSAHATRRVLALCPAHARLCIWAKPGGVPATTVGPHNRFESLIVVGGRATRRQVRDFLFAHPARGGGSLPGRKPIAFCRWLFDLLGMCPGDELVDVFPGTGIVARAWNSLAGDVDVQDPAIADRDELDGQVLEDPDVHELGVGTAATTRRPSTGDRRSSRRDASARARGRTDASASSRRRVQLSLRTSTTDAAVPKPARGAARRRPRPGDAPPDPPDRADTAEGTTSEPS